MKQFFGLSIFILLLLVQNRLISAPVNTEDFPPGLISWNAPVVQFDPTQENTRESKKLEKKKARAENLLSRIDHRLEKVSAVFGINNINDPVDRWFWYWVIAWGLGIILTIVAGGSIAGAGFGIAWFLLFAAGSVALILWLIKKQR